MSDIDTLPNFSNIRPDTIQNELTTILDKNRAEIKRILTTATPTWETIITPLEELGDGLHQFWAPIAHCHSVLGDSALRKAYNACLPLLTDYQTEIGQNKDLFNAIQTIANSEAFQHFTQAQKKTIENNLKDFKLSGIHLPEEEKKRFTELVKKSTLLANKFEENVRDATDAWHILIIDETQLTGLPEDVLIAAKKRAEEHQQTGYRFNLEAPVYLAVMTHADSRDLRKEMYTAYLTRASEVGPNAGKWDNGPVMQDMLTAKLERAKLLGYPHYAALSLEKKMVKSSDVVLKFLHELARQSLSQAKREFFQLTTFAKTQLKYETIEAWDVAYVSEKFRQVEFELSQETLRPYFPIQQVLNGLFDITTQLFNIRFEQLYDADIWHPDVQCFKIISDEQSTIGYFYIDLYARPSKRGGAWMDDCRGRRKRIDGSIQKPIAFLVCNFTPPTKNNPALLRHDDVETLFHEFGHSLQHLLTTIDYPDVSGINGIPWDAVELPSQFFEFFCWQQLCLNRLAQHYQTGKKLPETIYQQMIKSKNFHSALHMMRQLEFALFDFRLHMEFDPAIPNQIQKILDEVRSEVTVTPVTEFNRFQNGFGHIFGGGYAAGYYSYKWAEVMSADAFSLFEEKGIFNPEIAMRFKKCFLEPGGSEEPAVLFERFRGRPPQVEALLNQLNITNILNITNTEEA